PRGGEVAVSAAGEGAFAAEAATYSTVITRLPHP
ncbi:MAG: hypothetical protein ACI8P0_006475, partial [Planctomycetaceae bacterium]